MWAAPATTPKGLVALFHATGRRAHHWWPASTKCPSCKALPAEASLARACLKHGLAAATHRTNNNMESQTTDNSARRPRPSWRFRRDRAGRCPCTPSVSVKALRLWLRACRGLLPPSLPKRRARPTVRGMCLPREDRRRNASLSCPCRATRRRSGASKVRSGRAAGRGAEVLEQRAAPLALDDTYFSRNFIRSLSGEPRQLLRF